MASTRRWITATLENDSDLLCSPSQKINSTDSAVATKFLVYSAMLTDSTTKDNSMLKKTVRSGVCIECPSYWLVDKGQKEKKKKKRETKVSNKDKETRDGKWKK